ncbi:MAG: cupin domain-containing protein [bacterium]
MSENKDSGAIPVVNRLSSMVEYQDGSIVSRILIKRDKGTVTLFAFDEDSALSEHTAPFEALVLVIEGDSEVTIGGDAFSLTAGDTILLPANRPHSVKALSRFKMLLTMIRS